MKKILVMAILLSAVSVNSYSQIITFDSLRLMLSSTQYSYKNPCFCYAGVSYPNLYSLLVYEKWDSQVSNIAIRKIYYDSISSEEMITNNTTGQCINPSVGSNLMVWQSNVTGNWDIYYSLFSSGAWSPTAAIANTIHNETNPFILYNSTSPIQYAFYYLAYCKNNDIYFKSYRVSPATWYPDTNVTTGISYNCILPAMGNAGMGGTRKLYFSMVLNDTMKRIYEKIFTENYTTGIPSWNAGSELYQPKSQDNFRIINGNIFYEYDTLGGIHTIDNHKNVFTFQLTGKNSNSDGTNFGMITDNPLYWSYTIFATLNKRNDSAVFKVTKNLYSISPPNETNWKKFYLGNSSVNSKIAVSTAVRKNNYFKLYAFCEKLLNGRTALYATFMTDLASGVSNENETAGSYALYQNYPNPFNPTTVIKFSVPYSEGSGFSRGVGLVNLKVYEITGREVQTLVNETLQPGSYEVTFDGSGLNSGVYFYQLTTGNFIETRKMILIK